MLGTGRPEPLGRLAVVTDAREQLIQYIRDEAVFHGDFTLTSGKKASYYIDLRKVSLDHRVAPLIGRVIVELIDDIPDIAAVGGLTMGADPIASAVLHQGAALGKTYDAFVVRKQPKDHGRGKQVEGPDVAGKRVIVLEDTSTTGGSPLTAARASSGASGPSWPFAKPGWPRKPTSMSVIGRRLAIATPFHWLRPHVMTS